MTQYHPYFRPSEYVFIDRIEDQIAWVLNYDVPVLTDFLDPRQQYIVFNRVQAYSGIQVVTWGGFLNSERKRALIFPEYYSSNNQDFDISCLEIIYPDKFITLTHHQILGTLMNSGISRDILGDIITDGQRWQLLLASNFIDFLKYNMVKIGKYQISLEEVALSNIITPKEDWIQDTIYVNSLRLDLILAKTLRQSRDRIKKLIDHGDVKVNWQEVLKSDYVLTDSDMISIRRFGRVKIDSIEGKTKKGNYRVSVATKKNKR